MNYYGPKILRDAGFGSNTREGLMFSMIFLMSFNAAGNLSCISLSKRYGRRQMILACALPVFISMVVLDSVIISSAIAGHKFEFGKWLSLMSIASFLLFFSIGFASPPFTICSEIFPVRLSFLILIEPSERRS